MPHPGQMVYFAGMQWQVVLQGFAEGIGYYWLSDAEGLIFMVPDITLEPFEVKNRPKKLGGTLEP